MQDYFPQLLQTLGNLDTAENIKTLQNAAQGHPGDARPLLLIAAQFAEQGRVDEAEAAYITALERRPDFAIARFQLGLLQFSTGRAATACATWARLDTHSSSAALRLFKKGMACLAVDDFADAASLIQQGINANQENAPLNDAMQRLADEITRCQRTLANTATPAPDAGHYLFSAYRNLH